MFKITTQIVNNQWSVVVSNGTEERMQFTSELGLHTAEYAAQNLRRDIRNHGNSVIDFNTMPVIQQRLSQKGKPVRFTNDQ